MCSCDNYENIYYEVEKHCDAIKAIRHVQDSLDCLAMERAEEIQSLCDEIEDEDLRESIEELAYGIYNQTEESYTVYALECIEDSLLEDIEPLLNLND